MWMAQVLWLAMLVASVLVPYFLAFYTSNETKSPPHT